MIGTGLFIAALSLFIWNERENWIAEQNSNRVAVQLKDAIDANGNPYAEEESPEIEIEGEGYIGYLTIPRLGLTLPVMSEWSYPKLKIAPCRYSGSITGNDMVIAAHNYSRHFGRLKTLEIGDELTFTDTNNRLYSYVVEEVTTLQPTAITEMTNNMFDLTLFTCTYGGKSRVTIRCNRTGE